MALLDSIKLRRSIRKYKCEPVTDDLLNKLLEAASRTQTMGNLQLYSVVVTRDSEMKRKLSPAHFGQPMVTEASVVLTICADFNRTSVWCKNRKAVPGYNNFLSFINAASDALLYTQTFCNLAEEAGLGICYLGTTVYQPQTIIDVLHLPRLVMPMATLTVGWPDEEPDLTDRLPLASFIHQETYNDYTPTDIDSYYMPKEMMAENQHFVEINHKETLAQVFAEIRYNKQDNEIMSQTLLDVLRQQGFLQNV